MDRWIVGWGNRGVPWNRCVLGEDQGRMHIPRVNRSGGRHCGVFPVMEVRMRVS